MIRGISIAVMSVMVLSSSLALVCDILCAFQPSVPSSLAHCPSSEERPHPHGVPASNGDHGPVPSQKQHCAGHDNAVLAALFPPNLLTLVPAVTVFSGMIEQRLRHNELAPANVLPSFRFLVLPFSRPAPLVLRIYNPVLNAPPCFFGREFLSLRSKLTEEVFIRTRTTMIASTIVFPAGAIYVGVCIARYGFGTREKPS